jgi:ribosomal protein L29
MKFKELTIKTEAELKQLLMEFREKSHDLSVKLKLNQLKNTKELGVVKKDIAKIMTLLSSKAGKQN